MLGRWPLPRPARAARSARVRGRAFLSFDVIFGTLLLLLLATIFTTALRQLAVAARDSDARRILRLAAEAELSRLRAGLAELPAAAADPAETAAHRGVTIRVSSAPGTGAWQGLLLVHVEASRNLPDGKPIRVRLSGYLRPAGGAE